MMSFSKYFKLLMVFCCSFIMVENTDAQVRKRTTSTSARNKQGTKKEKVPETPIYEKINGELLFGNLGFFNGLSISTKVNVGYKLHERFSAGGGMKLFYDQFAVQGPDPSLLDLGGFVYGRGKITNEIYLQAEYTFMSYAYSNDFRFRNFPDGKNRTINFPMAGAGYMSGGDKWRFGIQLMFNFNQEAQDLQNSVIEYWFGASYNF